MFGSQGLPLCIAFRGLHGKGGANGVEEERERGRGQGRRKGGDKRKEGRKKAYYIQ